jgi:hypothetical protein
MSRITMEFARQDDCLNTLVPSDLRMLVTERDTAEEKVRELEEELRKAQGIIGEIVMAAQTAGFMSMNWDEAKNQYVFRLKKEAGE